MQDWSAGREPTHKPEPDPDLPHFRFHPDPLTTGSIAASDTTCPCCGKARGYALTVTPYALEEVEDLCPWCIADGSAAAMFDATFADDWPLLQAGVPDDLVAEVCERTPGFATIQQEVWQVHCERPAVFHGLLTDWSTLTDDDLADAYIPEDRWDGWRCADATASDCAFFDFRCEVCGKRLLWLDMS